jgi:hypothetical protein
VDLSGITKWAHGVMLGPPTGANNRIEVVFKSEWWRIGGAAVPVCADCGIVLAGKNGLKRHKNLHRQLIDLQEDVSYLYEYLEIEDGDGDSESSEDSTTGSGSEVHDAG